MDFEPHNFPALVASVIRAHPALADTLKEVFAAYARNEDFEERLALIEVKYHQPLRLILADLNEIDDPISLDQEIQVLQEAIDQALRFALSSDLATAPARKRPAKAGRKTAAQATKKTTKAGKKTKKVAKKLRAKPVKKKAKAPKKASKPVKKAAKKNSKPVKKASKPVAKKKAKASPKAKAKAKAKKKSPVKKTKKKSSKKTK